MVEYFGKGRTTITEHIQNVFSENELVQDATCRKFLQVQKESARTVKCKPLHDM